MAKTLADKLADLYSDKKTAKRIVDEAGLNWAAINTDGTLLDMWHAILVEGKKQNRVSAIAEIASEEYPEQAQEIRALTNASPPPLAAPPETTPQLPTPTETLTYDELMRRAIAAQNRAEQIWNDLRTNEAEWRKRFEEALGLLQRAEKLRRDDLAALLRMAQIQARLDPDHGTQANILLLHVEDLLTDPANDDQVRKLGEAFFLHANLSKPPNDKLLARARPLFEQLNDFKMLETIDALLHQSSPGGAGRASSDTPAPTLPETLTYDELIRRATRAQNRAEQIWTDTPTDEEAWRKKFEEALGLLQRAEKLRRDDVAALLQMAQVQSRLDPEYGTQAKSLVRRVEDLIGEPTNDDQVRQLGEAYFLHANLSNPPNEKLLNRARTLFVQLNDFKRIEKIDALLNRLEHPNKSSLGDFYEEPPARVRDDFSPLGRWNIQVQDMVGSRLLVEFSSNGAFQMIQQVGTYQVPVNGSWTFNPLTKQLALNGVVNTFQPFILSITISGKLPTGYAAVGNDGIGYVLTRG